MADDAAAASVTQVLAPPLQQDPRAQVAKKLSFGLRCITRGERRQLKHPILGGRRKGGEGIASSPFPSANRVFLPSPHRRRQKGLPRVRKKDTPPPALFLLSLGVAAEEGGRGGTK